MGTGIGVVWIDVDVMDAINSGSDLAGDKQAIKLRVVVGQANVAYPDGDRNVGDSTRLVDDPHRALMPTNPGAMRNKNVDPQHLIAGAGRDERRLGQLVERTGAPVRLLGRISETDKSQLMSAADIFAMLCRNRCGGLEQEGFGIVFVEAAAAGTPQIAGRSGGADEAVVDGVTGLVADVDADIAAVAELFSSLLDDPALRARLGEQGRARAVESFSYDIAAKRLSASLSEWVNERG